MHIVHTVSSVSSEAAGTSYVVPRLCQTLAELGNEVDLLSLGTPGAAVDENYKHTSFQVNFDSVALFQKLGISSAMRSALLKSDGEIFHSHGLWMMPNIYPAQVSRKSNRPFVLSPHGMLAPKALEISKNRKRVFGTVFQRQALRTTTVFHATSELEFESIRAFGLSQPVAIIPNGVDIPEAGHAGRGKARKTVLYLGRIHPIKNLETLLAAWKTIQHDHDDWSLTICGTGEPDYIQQLQQLMTTLKLDRAVISDPVYGSAKQVLYEQAELYVLPSKSENFAMTVAESLACGTPVISTKGAPWAGLESNGCGWWVDHGVEPMVTVLQNAMSLSAKHRQAMGHRGRDWMAADFSWEAISRQMLEVYQWAIAGGNPPESIRLD